MYPHDLHGSVHLIDWGALLLWFGPFDLANLLGRLEPGWRRGHEVDLLRLYHAELVTLGVEGYAWNDCWTDYRLRVLQRFCQFARYEDYSQMDVPTGWRFGNMARAFLELDGVELAGN